MENGNTALSAEQIQKLNAALGEAEAVVIGAGAGLSTSAGFLYAGERLQRFFSDFVKRYSFEDMYSGGFYSFPSEGEFWAYWSRYIYINRYMDPPKPVYNNLKEWVKEKDYFVITTNVDHCFQKTGFPKEKLFYTQGDYGLFQCSVPCHKKTYDNFETVVRMVKAQGFSIAPDGTLLPSPEDELKRTVPEALFPRCPVCGKRMSMNLRSDHTFVEDEGWRQAAERYDAFLQNCEEKKTLFLDVGTGFNTPGIFKVPFWQMTHAWKNAVYACLNRGEAVAPKEIHGKSILLNGDIGDILGGLLSGRDL